jgi:hypothetical protein
MLHFYHSFHKPYDIIVDFYVSFIKYNVMKPVKCIQIWCALVCFALPSCEHNLIWINLMHIILLHIKFDARFTKCLHYNTSVKLVTSMLVVFLSKTKKQYYTTLQYIITKINFNFKMFNFFSFVYILQWRVRYYKHWCDQFYCIIKQNSGHGLILAQDWILILHINLLKPQLSTFFFFYCVYKEQHS